MEEIDFQRLDEEAKRYASQKRRFTFVFVEIQLETDEGQQLIISDGNGNCTCGFFHIHGFCSHTMATEMFLQAAVKEGSNAATTSGSTVNLCTVHLSRA